MITADPFPDYLAGENVNGKRKMMAQRSGKPPGKLRKVFEDVSKLPRRQQEKIVEVVAALVMQYEQTRQ